MHSPKKIWASLITSEDYLPGLLTLHHTLVHVQKTAYPFYAFYTASFPASALEKLATRGIPTRLVPPIYPSHSRVYEQDPRFQEAWTKLGVFGLWGEEGEFERIVLLDVDMLVRRGIDELMEIELDDPVSESSPGSGSRVFASCHVCACNPLKKPHYPASWIPENCAYTAQHKTPDLAQTHPPPANKIKMLNSGLLVVRPAKETWARIEAALEEPDRLATYDFPDQDLLSDVFRGKWVALPYVFNALKTLRLPDVHGTIWRDEEVRIVHYIFAIKPWQDPASCGPAIDETHRWWREADNNRKAYERALGLPNT